MPVAAFDWEAFWATSRQTSWFEVGMCACFIISSCYSIARIMVGREIDRETVWARAIFLLGCAVGVAYKLFDAFDVAIVGYLIMLVVAFFDAALSSRARRAADDRRQLDELSWNQSHGRSSGRRSHRHSDGESSEHGRHSRRGWGRRSHSRRSDASANSELGLNVKEPAFDDPLAEESQKDAD